MVELLTMPSRPDYFFIVRRCGARSKKFIRRREAGALSVEASARNPKAAQGNGNFIDSSSAFQ
jgi:hypothetical protein